MYVSALFIRCTFWLSSRDSYGSLDDQARHFLRSTQGEQLMSRLVTEMVGNELDEYYPLGNHVVLKQWEAWLRNGN